MVGEKLCCRLRGEMVSLQFGFTNAVETLTWAVPGLALLLKSLLQATQENGWGEICCRLSREMVSLQCGFADAVETLTWAVPGLALLLKSLLQATQENGFSPEWLCQCTRNFVTLPLYQFVPFRSGRLPRKYVCYQQNTKNFMISCQNFSCRIFSVPALRIPLMLRKLIPKLQL